MSSARSQGTLQRGLKLVPGRSTDVAEAARAVADGTPAPDEARDEQVGGGSRPSTRLLPDVEDITAGDAACAGNSVRQAGWLVPCGNRKADGMAPHAIRPEIGGLPGALPAEHVCVRSADQAGRRLFRGLLVPFIGHVVIVADMHMPPGINPVWLTPGPALATSAPDAVAGVSR